MSEDVLEALVQALAAEVSKQYRVEPDRAATLIREEWSTHRALLQLAAGASSAKEVSRTRAYKDAAKATKRTIYHQLRAYRAEAEAFDEAVARLGALPPDSQDLDAVATEVATAHVSTAERMAGRAAFLEILDDVVPRGATVLDVGGGVLPLMLGSAWLAEHTAAWWVLDRDQKAIEAVECYARRLPAGLMHGVRWHLHEGWAAARAAGVPATADVALLLKVVPVVARQEQDLLPLLAESPAPRLLVSGSRVALAKRQDIEARERRVVRRWLEANDLDVVGQHRTADEFLYVVDRP